MTTHPDGIRLLRLTLLAGLLIAVAITLAWVWSDIQGPAAADVAVGLRDAGRGAAHAVEARVDAVEEGLLGGELGIAEAGIVGHGGSAALVGSGPVRIRGTAHPTARPGPAPRAMVPRAPPVRSASGW